MSIGLYRHPTLGQTKKYILNNKYVLQVKLDIKMTEDWTRQYLFFKQTFLKNKQIKFYLLPDQVYLEKEETYEDQAKAETVRIILYEHFVLTLREELQMRLKLKQKFSKSQLWYFLYSLSCGALEMIKIFQANPNGQELQINPDTILLNQYGYVKLMGYYSSPFELKQRLSYRASECLLTSQALPQKYEVCCSLSLGRTLASLIMLKDMDQYFDPKLRTFNDKKMLQDMKPYEDEIGMLFNIVVLTLSSNIDERLLVSEIKALLLPYEEEILNMKDFTLDRERSKESMMELFVNE